MAFPTLYPSSISGQFLDSSGRFRKIAHFENNVFLHAYCQNGAVSVVKNSLKINLKNNTRLDSIERVTIYRNNACRYDEYHAHAFLLKNFSANTKRNLQKHISITNLFPITTSLGS